MNIIFYINPIKDFNFQTLINKEKFGINEEKFNEYCKENINGKQIIFEKVYNSFNNSLN